LQQKDFFISLNSKQKEAVEVIDSHLVIEAGPGTGKTRVLTAKVLYLLEESVSPEKILTITFTNKASQEIKSRLSAYKGEKIPGVFTFHSWAYEYLKKEMGDFSVIGEEEQAFCFNLATKGYSFDLNKRDILKRIQLLKQSWPIDISVESDEIQRAWHLYHEFLKKQKFLDYDDLILVSIKLLLERKQVFYSFCLVDEFQDVSKAQYELLKALSKDSLVTIIGDPNQAIYGFRGASPKFMTEFKEDFCPVKEVFLDKAYRCPNKILDAAYDLFKSSLRPKAQSSTKGEIFFKIFENEEKEASWISKKIEELVGGVSFESFNYGGSLNEQVGLSEICILYRVNHLSMPIKKALSKIGIPYQLSVKDELEEQVILKLWHFFEAMSGNFADYHIERLSLSKQEKEYLFEIKSQIFDSSIKQDNYIEQICSILKIDSNFQNRQLVKKAISYFDQKGSFWLNFKNEQDLLDFDLEAVSLMSIHAAKGLEFKVVFLVGLDRDILPLSSSEEDEEKRLFFVGLTRSAEKVFITSTKNRTIFGKRHKTGPSPFINSIKPHLTIENLKPHIKKRPVKKRQKKLF